METMPRNVALFCQSCQKMIAVVPVRRLDRVYVPFCPHCVIEAEVVTLPGVELADEEDTHE
jgi:hypothetical protein